MTAYIFTWLNYFQPFSRVKPNAERPNHCKHKAVCWPGIFFVLSEWSNKKGEYIRLPIKKRKMNVAHHAIKCNYM